MCAKRLEMPELTIATSMHARDSLADGVSLYLAELRRIKSVVEAARAATANGPLLFYLLDEILVGTDPVERQTATRRVLADLLGQRAIGIISTHDRQVADDPTLTAARRPYHFRETIEIIHEEVTMSFDYRLRGGIAKSVNAAQLLDQMGLDLNS